MSARRRNSEIIKPLTETTKESSEKGNGTQHRRHSSWSLSDLGDFSEDDEIETMAEQLTNQRWHQVGNGPYPLCASRDFNIMVDQLSFILAMRLRDLLLFWMGGGDKHRHRGPNNSSSKSGKNNFPMGERNDAMALAMKYLKLDGRLGDYVLVDSLNDAIKEYVTCIGKLYNHVGFHSFEHATHVTISMNKLLSMVTTTQNYRALLKRRTSEQCVTSAMHNGGGGGENYSFGIGEDPRILFAMVFSALIHDVGHKGVPNSVLVDEEDDLAILHNDVSVAEQNSLQVAFSMLQRDEFVDIKKCICPNPTERKFFRKKVICMVMVTDISDQERIQIVKSRWDSAFPTHEEEEGAQGGKSDSNGNGRKEDGEKVGEKAKKPPSPPRHRKSEIQSQEIRENIRRRRFTMFTSDQAAEEFANEQRSRRLGIRTSMDFSGMVLDAYNTMDQLQQHAVLETMMNVADVAHTMQSFHVFVKWNRRLFKEFYVARLSGRLSFDPRENWYENQIGFFTHYIIPLSQKMKLCGVFGTTGNVFEYFAVENKKRWMEEGETISIDIIRDVTEEVEREQGTTVMNGDH